jgi:hypothetical protein
MSILKTLMISFQRRKHRNKTAQIKKTRLRNIHMKNRENPLDHRKNKTKKVFRYNLK